MNDIQSVQLTGRLTKDAEVKDITRDKNPRAVISFSMASNSPSSKEESGQRANFFDCEIYGKTVESLNKLAIHMTKGRAVTVSGDLRQDRWDKNDSHRSKVKVVVDKIVLNQVPNGQQVSHSNEEGTEIA